jgi:hypothetical protein
MSGMRQVVVTLAAVVLVAGAYGACFVLDARPERTGSWPVYLRLMFLAGLFGLGAGFVAGNITGTDEVADPVPRRVGRLALLLSASARICPALLDPEPRGAAAEPALAAATSELATPGSGSVLAFNNLSALTSPVGTVWCS